MHGVKVGGNPGITPTVMIGSIFYKGHSIIQDPHNGLFDEKKGETRIMKMAEQTDKSGYQLW
ncbi:MAG: hypothetical protein QGF78_03405 [Candidatus Bathyarchaeota archaeon]|nr:hypothetical protein [Candidatus Bathyarchaeota archaeon]